MGTWILLRGLMREQRHWGDFPAQLAALLPEAVIVTPDLPGNGTLFAQRSATRVADMVEFVRGDLRARGLPGPYHVLALSLGGMVAVEWAARYPAEVALTVLINTSMRPFSRFYQRLRWQNYPAILAMALLGGAARQERLILRLTSNRQRDGGQEDGALLARWTAYQHEYPVGRLNALRQLLSAARYAAPARRPAPPMLVLGGRGDRLVDVGCSRRLAAAWNAECRLHPGAGHDLPLDDGEWVARQVGQWMTMDGAPPPR